MYLTAYDNIIITHSLTHPHITQSLIGFYLAQKLGWGGGQVRYATRMGHLGGPRGWVQKGDIPCCSMQKNPWLIHSLTHTLSHSAEVFRDHVVHDSHDFGVDLPTVAAKVWEDRVKLVQQDTLLCRETPVEVCLHVRNQEDHGLKTSRHKSWMKKEKYMYENRNQKAPDLWYLSLTIVESKTCRIQRITTSAQSYQQYRITAWIPNRDRRVVIKSSSDAFTCEHVQRIMTISVTVDIVESGRLIILLYVYRSKLVQGEL